jgi:uncharacterized protein (DUF736 family)
MSLAADSLTLTLTAVVTSNRPGNKNPLDPLTGTMARGAKYWADPALIPQAIAYLEAQDFTVLCTDRWGIQFQGHVAQITKTFGVAINETDQTVPTDMPTAKAGTTTTIRKQWTVTSANGNEVLTIAIADPAQQKLFRGIILPEPNDDKYDKDLAGYEADFKNAPPNGKYPNQTLPHQLRRELCETDPNGDQDRWAKGDGVKIVVIDNGFDGSHPYWKAANLEEKAKLLQSRNCIPQDFYQKAAQAIAGLSPFLPRLTAHRTAFFNLKRSLVRAHRAPSRQQGKQLITEFKATLKEMAAQHLRTGRLETQIDSFLKHYDQLRLPATILNCLNVTDTAIHEVNSTIVAWQSEPEGIGSHGTAVAGQILAIAPNAEIHVICDSIDTETTAVGQLYKKAYGSHDFNSASIRAEIRRLKPDILVHSKGRETRVASRNTMMANKQVYMSQYGAMLELVEGLGGLLLQACGNSASIFGPGRVDIDPQNTLKVETRPITHFFQSPHLVQVGGSARPKRHDLSGAAIQSAHPSNKTLGFTQPAVDGFDAFTIPHISGLAGKGFSTQIDAITHSTVICPIVRYKLVNSVRTPKEGMHAASATSYTNPQVAAVIANVWSAMGSGYNALEIKKRVLANTSQIIGGGQDDYALPVQKMGSKAPVSIFKLPKAEQPGMVDLDKALNTQPDLPDPVWDAPEWRIV